MPDCVLNTLHILSSLTLVMVLEISELVKRQKGPGSPISQTSILCCALVYRFKNRGDLSHENFPRVSGLRNRP